MPDAVAEVTEPEVRPFMASPSLEKLATALAQAQAEFTTLGKNKKANIKSESGASFAFGYADLAAVLEVIRPGMAKHGLSVVQLPERSGNGIRMTTVLFHSSGQWIAGLLEWPVGKQDARGIGSAITYGRRYGVTAIAGVAAEDEDDDGEAAAERAPERQRQQPRRSRPGSRASEPEVSDASGTQERVEDTSEADERITTTDADGSPGGQKAHLVRILREHKVNTQEFGAHITEKYGYRSWGEIRQKDFDEILALAQAWPHPATANREPGQEG